MVFLGGDAVGKTFLLYKMKLGEHISTIPTLGFNVESIQYKGYNYTVWDIGGMEKMVPLWKHYLSGIERIVFIINGSRGNLRQYYAELFMKVVEYYRTNVSKEQEINDKILILSNIFEMNEIQINLEEFVDDIKNKTKFLGKISSIQCSAFKDEPEKLKILIFDFFIK